MRHLYLDDLRNPVADGFVVVRSVQEAIDYCEAYGCPEYISFDHDLGENVESGLDFVKWLVDTDLERAGTYIPHGFQWNVHSANPVGAANIDGLLRSYIAFRNQRRPE